MAWPSSLLARLQASGDISSTLLEDEDAAVAAKITASGDSASVVACLSASVEDDEVETSVSARAEAEDDGTTVVSTGDATATGETASVAVDLTADADTEDLGTVAEGAATAEAEAEAAEGGDAAVTADTDVDVTGADLALVKHEETVETDDDTPTIISTTDVTAVRVEGVSLDDATAPDVELTTSWSDADWSLS